MALVVVAVVAEGVEEGGLWVVGGGRVVVEIGACEDVDGGVGDEVLVEVGEGCVGSCCVGVCVGGGR